MLVSVICVGIVVVAVAYRHRINKMFDRPTAEELENYQESVFLNIEEQIKSYEENIAKICKEEGQDTVDELRKLLVEFDLKMKEYTALEERLDKKLVQFNSYSKLIG